MSATQRTDPHRPADLVPADYQYLGVFYQGDDTHETRAYRTENERHRVNLLSAPQFTGNWAAKGTCDVCGARFLHGAYFTHTPTGETVHTGQDCAEKMEIAAGSSMANERGAIKARVRGSKKHAARNAEHRVFLGQHPGLAEALECDHDIVRYYASKFRRYGTLSPKQVAFALKPAAEARRPVPAVTPSTSALLVEGKGVEITGRVVSTKWAESQYGDVRKMLVEDDRGFRVFGTAPACLGDVDRGARVRFIADTSPAAQDPSFGWFAYPRCAENITSRPVAGPSR